MFIYDPQKSTNSEQQVIDKGRHIRDIFRMRNDINEMRNEDDMHILNIIEPKE